MYKAANQQVVDRCKLSANQSECVSCHIHKHTQQAIKQNHLCDDDDDDDVEYFCNRLFFISRTEMFPFNGNCSYEK